VSSLALGRKAAATANYGRRTGSGDAYKRSARASGGGGAAKILGGVRKHGLRWEAEERVVVFRPQVRAWHLRKISLGIFWSSWRVLGQSVNQSINHVFLEWSM